MNTSVHIILLAASMSSVACVVIAVSRLQDVQWRLDTVVVNKNLMAGELRLGLQVMEPASGAQCTHSFSVSAQQLHLLLAGGSLVNWMFVECVHSHINDALEFSHS
jgi:hypothetical protein